MSATCRSALKSDWIGEGRERGEDVKAGGWEECEVRSAGDVVRWLLVPEATETKVNKLFQ